MLKITIFAAVLLALSCNFGDMRAIRMSLDGDEISAGGAQIAISQVGAESYNVFLHTKRPEIQITWEAKGRDFENWRGEKFRVKKFRAVRPDGTISFEGADVGVIIDITDIEGAFVTGRFSGWVGIGAGSHRVSNGTFRAPASFWRR